MKPRLVRNWRRGWRWFSVRCMAAAVAMQGTYMALPESLQQQMPSKVGGALVVAILVLGIVGRLIDQEVDDVEMDQ